MEAVELADPGQRVLARIVDTLVVGLPVVMVLLETVPRSSLDDWGPPLVAGALLVYETVQTALWGRTVGKRVAGIAVVRQAADGAGEARPGWGASLLRAATYSVPVALRPIPVVGLLAGIFWVVNLAFVFEGVRRGGTEPEGPRLALHDRFAGTVVVRTTPAPAPDGESDREPDGDDAQIRADVE